MKIVVTTPTGNVGSHLARMLVQAGERPTLLARDYGRIEPDIAGRCDVIEADLGETAAVVRACVGANALYWVDPPTGDDDPIAGYERMGRNAAAAISENRIARVVFQSSVGAEARHGFGEIDGLALTEQLLDATGASVTHLRCGYFMTNLLMDLDSIRAGELSTTLPIDRTMPWVDPRDIAEIAALRLLSTAWSGRHVQGVHGPEDLSFADVAETITRVTGHTVRARQVSDADVAAQLRAFGMTDAQIDGIVGMSRGLREGFTPEQPRDAITTTFGRLDAWVQSTLRPLLGTD